MPNDSAPWFPAALICAATLIAYSNSFSGGFVLDSQSRILEDPRITAATSENLKLILTKDYWYPTTGGGLYRPLATLSYLFDYAIVGNGRSPAGYHVVNLLLHWLNIVLLYRIALGIFGEIAPAAAVAAIWALHPVATESVTNIVGRADLITTAAVLGALLCHMQARSKPLAIAAIVTAGVFAKENAVVIPAVMAIYDFTFTKKARLPNYAGAVAPLLVFGLARALVFAHLPPVQFPYVMNPLIGAGFVVSRLTAFKVIGKHLALLIWPAKLSCDYSYNQIPMASWQDWQAILALVICLAALGVAARSFQSHKPIFFAVGFFFVTLLPTSNLIVRIGSIMAERFLYLPSIAFATCVVYCGINLAQSRSLQTAALTLLLIALTARTYIRNQDWRDNQTLFASAVRVSPQSFKTHWSMAYLLENANLDAAIHEIDESVAILDHLPDDKNAAPAYDLAGELYRKKGDQARNQSAANWYRASLEALEHGVLIDRAGKTAEPHFGWEPLYRNLGITRLRLGDASQALEALQHARSLKPSDPEIYINMIAAWRDLQNTGQARQILLEGLTLVPQHPQLLEELARAYPSCSIRPGADLLRLNQQCPDLHQHLCAAQTSLVRWLAENTYAKEAQQAEDQARDRLGCRN